MTGAFRTRVARALRRTALPLTAYYAVTLALPLANGAARSGTFLRHALVVLVIPLIGVALGCAVSAIVHGSVERCRPRVGRRDLPGNAVSF